MKLVIFGLSITSSWGNGHATTYRSLLRAFAKRGHEIEFFECRQPWYAENRDLTESDLCKIRIYANLAEVKKKWTSSVAEADVVIVGSYVPQGVELGDWITQTASGLTAFYDIDTPVTIATLLSGQCTYLSRRLIRKYDLYLSFTGGPTLERLVDTFGACRAEALYCSVDPEGYHPEPARKQWTLGYLGTYSSDRQESLEELLFKPAALLPQSRFAVAGAQYPPGIKWPPNVEHIDHVAPDRHCAFYNAQLFTLNLTRKEMIRLGWSPSVRLFEAAACGTPLISDYWDGLEDFFELGSEIIVARDAEAVRNVLLEMSETERGEIGSNARRRILSEHTAAHRAKELEEFILGSGQQTVIASQEVA